MPVSRRSYPARKENFKREQYFLRQRASSGPFCESAMGHGGSEKALLAGPKGQFLQIMQKSRTSIGWLGLSRPSVAEPEAGP